MARIKFKRVFIGSTILYATGKIIAKAGISEEAKMEFDGRANLHGLKHEKHFIITDDDYILQVFRLYDGKVKENKPAVLMQHGLQDSSLTFMSNSDKSPAVVLAKSGYDVWLNNSRGTGYSRFHKTLDPDSDTKYWDFTFHEMGLHDTKACLKYIKSQTSQDKVSYIGCSQGASMMLSALAKDSDWFKDHMNAFIALCPVTKFCEEGNKSLSLLANEKIFRTLQKLGIEEIKPNSKGLQSFYCSLLKLIPPYGPYYVEQTSDSNADLINFDSLQKLWYIFPRGCNVVNFIQWGSGIRNRYFADRHYSEEENLRRYGKKEAPPMDLTKINSVPIAMLCGRYDKFSPVEYSEWTRNQVKPEFYKMYDNHGHITFLVGKDMSYLDDVQKLLKQYSTKSLL